MVKVAQIQGEGKWDTRKTLRSVNICLYGFLTRCQQNTKPFALGQLWVVLGFRSQTASGWPKEGEVSYSWDHPIFLHWKVRLSPVPTRLSSWRSMKLKYCKEKRQHQGQHSLGHLSTSSRWITFYGVSPWKHRVGRACLPSYSWRLQKLAARLREREQNAQHFDKVLLTWVGSKHCLNMGC